MTNSIQHPAADRELYRHIRHWTTLPAIQALWMARRPSGRQEYYRHLMRADRQGKRERVKLDANGVARLRNIAEMHGVTLETYLEALMHYAISCDERPGSWEAQGFDFRHYDDRDESGGYADRWF